MARQSGQPPVPPGAAGLKAEQFQFEVAQEIGVDLGRINPQKVNELEKRLHSRRRSRS